jgi:hypothetical protein
VEVSGSVSRSSTTEKLKSDIAAVKVGKDAAHDRMNPGEEE